MIDLVDLPEVNKSGYAIRLLSANLDLSSLSGDDCLQHQCFDGMHAVFPLIEHATLRPFEYGVFYFDKVWGLPCNFGIQIMECWQAMHEYGVGLASQQIGRAHV